MVDLLEELNVPQDNTVATESVTVDSAPSDPVVEVAPKSALDKLLDDIAPVSKTKAKRKIMLYGDPGTGKTALSCGVGAESFGDGVLMVAVEPGQLTLENHPELAKVRVLSFKAVAQVIALIEELKKMPPELSWCHTFVIDTFTTLQERDLKNITVKAAAMDSSRNPNLPVGSDYQINTENMKAIARALTDLSTVNVVLTAHVKEEKDESTGRLLVRPSLTPKLASAVAGMVDMVGYLTVTADEAGVAVRNLQVHPTDKVVAKTRIGNLPAVVTNPVITNFLAKE